MEEPWSKNETVLENNNQYFNVKLVGQDQIENRGM